MKIQTLMRRLFPMLNLIDPTVSPLSSRAAELDDLIQNTLKPKLTVVEVQDRRSSGLSFIGKDRRTKDEVEEKISKFG